MQIMKVLKMFIDIYALLVLLVINAVSFGLFFKQTKLLVRIDKTTELSFYISVVVSLSCIINSLSNISDIKINAKSSV